ncbi:MAG: exodeoxyribonuclease V subunit alpha, partial [Moraxella sp.]|nr:exodeoxyribonuclease V subunit alpha [Moraxella sp.]
MHSPVFPKELQALSLAHYILARIRTHADVYQENIAPYKVSKNDEVLFLSVYLLMSLHLQEGNTMLRLSCDENQACQMDTWGLWEQGFSGWQFELTKKLLPLLDAAMGEVYQSFGLDVATMMRLSSHELPDFMQSKINEITTKAYTLGTGEKIQLADFVRLVFGFLYVCHHRFGDDLYTFYQHLCALPFFGDQRIFVISQWHAGFGLWFTRSFLAEQALAKDIKRLLTISYPPMNYAADDGLNNEQKNAIRSALTSSFTIITGGPGTGKTHTVGRLVIELLRQNADFTIALVAPTSKAAQRMQESLQRTIQGQAIHLSDAMTIHRLLGMGVDGVPRYHKDSQLPFDMIVVDEASMLGVELAQKLLAAIATGTRLILLGDDNQLAAVDAGAVLGDLCRVAQLKKFHQKLTQSHRFHDNSAIGQLAKLIQAGTNTQSLITLLKSNGSLDFVNVSSQNKMAVYEQLTAPFLSFFEYIKNLKLGALSSTQKQLALVQMFDVLNRYRILTASHRGDFGDIAINDEISRRHLADQNVHRSTTSHMHEWYHGRVVMVTKNSYDLALFNGDIGVCVNEYHGNERHSVVYFDGKEAGVPTAMLPSVMVTTAYAMTIHKSQGSEFERVAVCFDDDNARMLGRELLYTGITRAKDAVAIYATPSAIERA